MNPAAAPLALFAVTLPGMEPFLADEMRTLGFEGVAETPGGVDFAGGWADVWRANLLLRGASRVLARVAEFRALHLAQLDKRARRVDWAAVLRLGVPVAVEATCRASRIYHAGAAAQRIAGALNAAGVPVAADASLRLMVRIEDDLCTISLDTSGELLHRRGYKEAVGKAPLRETMAALFLRAAGYDGREPVLDPMCGSGTFVIEAAQISAGLLPGRVRSFAFENLVSFDAAAYSALRNTLPAPCEPDFLFHGSDRDQGAVQAAIRNAKRANVDGFTRFEHRAVSEIEPPAGPAGLVIANPPYGARIGDRKLLFGLYGAFGKILTERFTGWRAAIVTSDEGLARSTGLPFAEPGPQVNHGGLRVRLWQTGPLG